MAVCGANCMGFVDVERGLRALAFEERADLEPGNVAWISHSGSAFSALLHAERGIHFNLAVSTGQELSTTMADYMLYALERDSTRVISLFLETIRDPDNFKRALATAAERDVPVVALKVGRAAASAPARRRPLGRPGRGRRSLRGAVRRLRRGPRRHAQRDGRPRRAPGGGAPRRARRARRHPRLRRRAGAPGRRRVRPRRSPRPAFQRNPAGRRRAAGARPARRQPARRLGHGQRSLQHLPGLFAVPGRGPRHRGVRLRRRPAQRQGPAGPRLGRRAGLVLDGEAVRGGLRGHRARSRTAPQPTCAPEVYRCWKT